MKSCDFVDRLLICVFPMMWLWTVVVFPLQLMLWGGSYCTHSHCSLLAAASTCTSAASASVSVVKTLSVIFFCIIIHFLYASIDCCWHETFRTQNQENQSTPTHSLSISFWLWHLISVVFCRGISNKLHCKCCFFLFMKKKEQKSLAHIHDFAQLLFFFRLKLQWASFSPHLSALVPSAKDQLGAQTASHFSSTFVLSFEQQDQCLILQTMGTLVECIYMFGSRDWNPTVKDSGGDVGLQQKPCASLVWNDDPSLINWLFELFSMRFSCGHDKKSLTYVKLLEYLCTEWNSRHSSQCLLNVSKLFSHFFALVEVMESVTVW